MPDDLHARAAQILKAAADDTRLALLLHAHQRGLVAPKDTPGDLSGGTPSYHVRVLREAGLLERSGGRGEHRLTALGSSLLRAAGVPEDGHNSTISDVEDWLPPGTELVATLERQLPSGQSDSTSIHLLRP
jgi:DNA-binding transcriptional ArsR family regulator